MPKAESFLQKLDYLRAFSCDQPVYRLLWEIYDRTGALGLYGALPGGAQRESNLLAFFERARAFEEQGFRGLFSFVNLLRGMEQTGEDFQTVGAEATGSAVRIMSIHKSKGLEFPVVIVADCAKNFNEKDLNEPVLVHQELGFGSRCRDLQRGVQYKTVEQAAVAVQQRREMVSEELRVLYVAMTRAREKLILTGASGTLASQLKKWAQLAQLDTLPQYAMGSVRTPLAWLITPLLRHPCTRALRETYDLIVPEHGTDNDAFSVELYTPEMLPEPECEVVGFTEPAVRPMMRYPHECLTELPSKLTATGVGRGYRSEEAAEETPPPRREVKLRAPLFEAAEKKLTPAEAGTAHHLFMQFCDFAEAEKPGGVERELHRLAERGILSEKQAGAVRIPRIEAFFASDLYRGAARVQVFRPRSGGAVFPGGGERAGRNVLLQGVIDCLIRTEKGYVILDFKTDRVSEKSLPERAESYRAQLDAYAAAVREICGGEVYESVLYFFQTGTVWKA